MKDSHLPDRRAFVVGLPLAAATLMADASAAEAEDGPSSLFDPRAFGALGDDRADDTEAFVAMHRAMRLAQRDDERLRSNDPSRPPIEMRVALGDGRYRYRWNRWTWGLRRVRVSGEGAGLRCLNPGPWHVDQFCLVSNRDHYSREPTAGPMRGGTERFGSLIATAEPGDEAVTLLDPRGAPEFAPGAWVLVQSYAQQQYGYPPNPRHFERARVRAVEGSTVRLDRPLFHAHRDDWPEDSADPAAIGRARLVPIDLPDCPLAERQVFEGLRCLENPHHSEPDPGARRTLESFTVSGCLEAFVRDCDLIALGMTQCGAVHVARSAIVYCEPDKLISRATFENCRIDSLQQATGVDRLVLRDCVLGSDAQMLARDVVATGCDFPGDAATPERFFGVNLEGPTPTRRMLVSRCRFRPRRPQETRAFRGSVWIEVPVDGRDVVPTTGGILRARSGAPARAALLDVLSEGWPALARRRDGTLEPGRCVAIRGAGDDAEIAFDFADGLAFGDVLRIPRLLSLRVEDCDFGAAVAERPDPPRLDWLGSVAGSRTLRTRLRSDDMTSVAWPPGWPVSLRVRVTRPWRGEGRWVLETRRRGGALLAAVDLGVAGETRLGAGGTSDPFRDVGLAFDIETAVLGMGGASADAAAQAEAFVEIVVDPPFSIDGD